MNSKFTQENQKLWEEIENKIRAEYSKEFKLEVSRIHSRFEAQIFRLHVAFYFAFTLTNIFWCGVLLLWRFL